MADRISRLTLTLAAVDRMTHVINKATGNAIKKFEQLEKQTRGMASASIDFAQKSAGIALATGAAMAVPIKTASEFEQAMLGVAKQVKGARDESGALTSVYFDMAKKVKELSLSLPMLPDDIARMVTEGARMGIANDQLIEFTKNTAMMAEAFEMVPADIAENMGKLSVIFKIPIPQLGALGDAVNYLGDNFLSNGKDIIEVMQRIGGTANGVKMTAQQTAALASTFLSLSETPERAATAATALIRELSVATRQPERFQRGLRALGMNAMSIQTGMVTDAQGTIMKVLEAINKVDDIQKSAVVADLFGDEYFGSVIKLAGGIGEYRKQLNALNDTELKGSMSREFQARLATFDAKLRLFNNQMRVLAINFGNAVLPALIAFGEVVTPVIQAMADFTAANPRLSKVIGVTALSVAGLAAGLSVLGFVSAGILNGITVLSVVIGKLSWWTFVLRYRWLQLTTFLPKVIPMLRGLFLVLTSGVRALGMAMAANPIGAIIAGIAVAAFLIYTYWEPISGFFMGLWNNIKKGFEQGFVQGVWETLKTLFTVANPFAILIQTINGVVKYFFDIDLFAAGEKILQTLIDGIKSKVDAAYKTMADLTAGMRAYLPFSPAKEGAFRDLHRVKIVETIAQAIKPQPLMTAMGGIMNVVANPPTAMPAMVGASGGGGGVVLNYNPTVNITGGAGAQEKEAFMEVLRQHKKEILRMIAEANERDRRLRF